MAASFEAAQDAALTASDGFASVTERRRAQCKGGKSREDGGEEEDWEGMLGATGGGGTDDTGRGGNEGLVVGVRAAGVGVENVGVLKVGDDEPEESNALGGVVSVVDEPKDDEKSELLVFGETAGGVTSPLASGAGSRARQPRTRARPPPCRG